MKNGDYRLGLRVWGLSKAMEKKMETVILGIRVLGMYIETHTLVWGLVNGKEHRLYYSGSSTQAFLAWK